MKGVNLASACLLVSHLFVSADSIRWLALSKSHLEWNRTSQCVQAYKQHFIAAVQKRACKRNVHLMPLLKFASGEVVATCQDVFASYRWNCSSIVMSPNYGPDLTKGTRERAYVHALAAASVANVVAKACSDGRLTTCSCGRVPKEPPPGNFLWGGCADNVKYGILMAKAFTEAPWNRRKFRKSVDIRMNRHNSRTGWRSVNTAVRTQCKCHGVSGSCDVKTCWRALPSIRELALNLKRKYQEANEVEARRVGTRWKLFPQAPNVRFSKDDLVFVVKSPDFCEPDETAGSDGTRGRKCNETSLGSDGCANLCCGRGHVTSWTEHVERCGCKYHWCCYVKCDSCTVQSAIHTCL